jgi:hypothetical protein
MMMLSYSAKPTFCLVCCTPRAPSASSTIFSELLSHFRLAPAEAGFSFGFGFGAISGEGK